MFFVRGHRLFVSHILCSDDSRDAVLELRLEDDIGIVEHTVFQRHDDELREKKTENMLEKIVRKLKE